jgi:multiple sugar transport system ATP-binding protein
MADKLGLSLVLDRQPKTMSGGEKQRLALGRALVREPRFFLLDEPLSSLDAPLRFMIRSELKRLQKEEGHSFLMATPDFSEALAVADTVITLNEGEVVQIGTPEEIYRQPVDTRTALFVGSPRVNLLSAGYDGERLRFLGLDLDCPERLKKALGPSGPKNLTIGLRPEGVKPLGPGEIGGGPAEGRLPVVDIESLGRTMAVTVKLASERLTMLAESDFRSNLAIGETAAFRLTDPESLLAFDPATGRNLLAPPA